VQINWPSLVVHPSHNGDDELLLKNKAFSSKENAMEKEKVSCNGGGREGTSSFNPYMQRAHFSSGGGKEGTNWSLQKERNTKST
jgi:hypothetical protein